MRVDETLLSAALRAGIGFPRMLLRHLRQLPLRDRRGRNPVKVARRAGLNARDRRLRRQLACQARPLTDCIIRLRLDARYVPTIRPRRMTGVLRAIEQSHPTSGG